MPKNGYGVICVPTVWMEKFRRQQAIGSYIVDFVHFGARLVVEADGGQHNENPGDTERDTWLNGQGFRVMRFWNNDILNNTDTVLEAISKAVLDCRLLSPSPSPTRGEGSKHLS